MSTLRDRLMEKVAAAEQVKVAEEVFVNAFIDELEKLGVSGEMLKSADLLGAIKRFASSPFRRAAAKGGVALKLDRSGSIGALARNTARANAQAASGYKPVIKWKQPAKPSLAPAAPYSDFPLHGKDKSVALRQERARTK